MFSCVELEKIIYVHPVFLGLWSSDPFRLSKHLLQSQLVNHVLKDVGLVIIVNRVLDIRGETFDPMDGGIYARVRFKCYVYNPVTRALIKGRVERVDSDGLQLTCGLIPVMARVPTAFLRPGTVFHPEQRSYIWTKIVEGSTGGAQGGARYFETKVGDEVKFQVDAVEYDPARHISVFKSPSADLPTTKSAMEIVGDVRTYSLGPVHWYTAPRGSKEPVDADKTKEEQLAVASARLNVEEKDYLTFLQSLLPLATG